MSINLNKENFYKNTNDNKNKIIDFPYKNNKLNIKETNLVIADENKTVNKFYSVDDSKTKLTSGDENNDVIDFNNPKEDDSNKLPPKPIAITILGVILVCIVIWALTHKNAQEVYVGDSMVGIVKPTDKEDLTAESIKELALAELSSQTGANVEVNEEVSLKPVRASKDEISSLSEVVDNVSKSFTFKVEASVITVDGDAIATVKNQDEANKILDSIKEKYINKDVKQVSQATFLESVKIENKYVAKDDVMQNEEALSILTTNKDQGKEYEIKEGDTLYQIAIDNNMSLENLLKANPTITETTPLKIGSKINLIVPVPLLSVVTYEEAVYTEVIPKTIETINNDNEYKTYKKVISEGKDGSKQVTAKITKINGIEDKRDIISETVLTEPVVEKVEVGTLNTPPKKAIGSFIYPVNGSLSSGYGVRWGTMHKGIDLACPAGTPIKASDGGTVVYSGWNSGGYGYMVKIDHGNGYQTIYAHNSKNAVSVGQKVAQGEVIAYVGSTGYSTGNHLHFEVVDNGVSKNPLNYLK